MALEGQLNNPGDTGQAISEDENILGRLRGVEDGDDLGQLQMLMGGNATNLDGLDREQIEKILDQEYYDDDDGQNF
jgi:sigma54-dependent transcription regulator